MISPFQRKLAGIVCHKTVICILALYNERTTDAVKRAFFCLWITLPFHCLAKTMRTWFVKVRDSIRVKVQFFLESYQ